MLAGCPKKISPDDDGKEVLPPPSARLQVAGIEPGSAPSDRAFAAEILGSGFERDARVNLSGAAIDGAKVVDAHTVAIQVPSMPPGAYDVTVINPDGVKSTLRKGLVLTEGRPVRLGCAPATVRFDYDSSVLSPGTRSSLDAFAPCARDAGVDVRVEGHCDEDGTTDYNLALGQRRAESVQRYLVGLGVSPAHLRAISYGEERPADRSGTPAANAANRRVEIIPRE